MASRSPMDQAQPGDILLVVHDFVARSPDELGLVRGDRIELIERDDEFGDGWFLGRHLQNNQTGLFPEVYTTPAPRATLHQRQAARPPADYTGFAAPSADDANGSSGQPSDDPRANAGRTNSSLETPPTSRPSTGQAPPTTSPLQISPASSMNNRSSLAASTTSRGLSMALGGALNDDQGSPVMNETLSVIDEHITDMNTPRHSVAANDRRANDSSSEYSSHVGHRLSYINGHETDEEEQNVHTEEEVSLWTPARVAEYLEDVGVEKRHCDVFREQEISGEVLLAMDQATIFLKEFELGPVGPRLRTWLKIKSLQQEVKSARKAMQSASDRSAGEDSAGEMARNRATSVGTVVPRAPSYAEGAGSPRAASRQSVQRATSQLHGKVEAPSPLSNVTPALSPGLVGAPRPSAASVRSLNHNRRHSSIDYAGTSPIPGINEPAALAPGSPPVYSHKKTPSFDRNWSMGAPKPQELRRPSSSLAQTVTVSSEGSHYDASPNENGMTLMSPSELDRGYFSGNELDARKGRNVLRKKESPAHSRNPSHASTAVNQWKRHSRIGSVDSVRDAAAAVSNAAKAAYYGQHHKTHRSASNSEFLRPLTPADVPASPTVTKLEFGPSPRIEAVTATPSLAGNEAASTGRASPSPALHSISFFSSKKGKSSGLRAISDAITGNEKALAAGSQLPSPVKENPISPTRTGSSTPSAHSKSFEFENSEMSKRSASSGTATALGTARKKGKKGTSAFLRGLESKTPAEQMVGCDYSGWMKKRSSNIMTTWKTRLFVLRGRRLSYYYSENDTEEKGLIDISSHRVLPADNERITGLHATLTGATASPTSPHNASIATQASTEAAAAAASAGDPSSDTTSGMFIFKLVPPRSGLSKAVNFTKPTVHYFAVDNVQQGRLWMAALMKATIDRDDAAPVVSTYQQKTISLVKARAMRQRPPALRDEEAGQGNGEGVREREEEGKGLAISGLSGGGGGGEEKGGEGGGGLDGERSGKSVDLGGEANGLLPEASSAASADGVAEQAQAQGEKVE